MKTHLPIIALLGLLFIAPAMAQTADVDVGRRTPTAVAHADGGECGGTKLQYPAPEPAIAAEGSRVNGIKHGHFVLRFADGDVWQGPYVNGVKHGHWVVRLASGAVGEGPFVEDQKQGKWSMRLTNGDVGEGQMANDVTHGYWVLRYANGDVWEGPYFNGERHGFWFVRFAGVDDTVGEVCFVRETVADSECCYAEIDLDCCLVDGSVEDH